MSLVRQVFDAHTAKVSLAVMAPLALRLTELRETVQVLTAVGACIYIWIKVIRVAAGKEK